METEAWMHSFKSTNKLLKAILSVPNSHLLSRTSHNGYGWRKNPSLWLIVSMLIFLRVDSLGANAKTIHAIRDRRWGANLIRGWTAEYHQSFFVIIHRYD